MDFIARKHLLLRVIMVLFCCGIIQAQTPTPPTSAELSEIAARGRLIAEYDAAAWHSTDAVKATNPPKGSHTSYIGKKGEDGRWVVVFGRFDESGNSYLVTGEARQLASPDKFTVVLHDPPLPDKGFYFKAARAEKTALDAFNKMHPARIFNFTVLPTASDEWFVYAIPAQTDWNVLPYGGDVRYRISPDGTSILETRQMHKTVLEEGVGKEHPEFGFHTHFLSNIPEDTDIFYALTRKARLGELLVTPKFVYEFNPDTSISVIGPTETVIAGLEKNDCKLFVREINLCVKGMDEVRKHVVELSLHVLHEKD